MANLDALSREIAATSGKWATAGVRVLLDGARWRPVRLISSEWMVVEDTGRRLRFELTAADIPDLLDQVTVNSLLGDGEVIRLEHPKGWTAYIGEHSAYGNDTRTTAICRAWIAAHKEKGNG